VKIFTVEYKSDELIDGEILDRKIVIEASDNSPEHVKDSIANLAASAMKSESLERLIRNIKGEIEVRGESLSVIRRVILPIPRDGNFYVNRISKLRSEAIKYVAVGYIRLSFIFGVVAFPGYLYLGIDKEIVLILLAQFFFTGLALTQEKKSSWLAGIGTILAISIFPILSLQQHACQEIQYLPWLFNSIIGSVFLVSMLVRNSVLRWLPAIIFYLACTEITSQLPESCKHLLDGSTPGILLVSLVAIGISYARKRDLTSEERFIKAARMEFDRISSLREKVISERAELIGRIESFTTSVEANSKDEELTEAINTLILEIRAFLLLSEYLDNPLIRDLHSMIKTRFKSGSLTYLEVNCSAFPTNINEEKSVEALDTILKWAGSRRIRISLSRSEDLVLQANLVPEQASEETKSGHHQDSLTFHFAY
jgi:hypothetical protein